MFFDGEMIYKDDEDYWRITGTQLKFDSYEEGIQYVEDCYDRYYNNITVKSNMIYSLEEYIEHVTKRLTNEYPSITFNYSSIEKSYSKGLNLREAADICYNETIKEMNDVNMTYFQY